MNCRITTHHPLLLFPGLAGIVLLLAFKVTTAQVETQRYRCEDGRIDFTSDAPLEVIKAGSNDLRGVLESDGKFAFTVMMASFEGFNSGLQKEHFRENYLEIARFPKAEFSGEFIGTIVLHRPGTYSARVRGQLLIHGISRERILPITLTVMPDGKINANAQFQVPLRDHDIGIPKIMHQKIAESIQVQVEVIFI